MAKVELLRCDGCGSTGDEADGFRPFAFVVDRCADAAGSMENVVAHRDLCPACQALALGFCTQALDYVGARRVIALLDLRMQIHHHAARVPNRRDLTLAHSFDKE